MLSFNTGSLDVYVTCFSDVVNRVPGLGLRVWAYMVGQALLRLLLDLLLYLFLSLIFGACVLGLRVYSFKPNQCVLFFSIARRFSYKLFSNYSQKIYIFICVLEFLYFHIF